LTALTWLDFASASSLTGTIPTELGRLTSLMFCYDKNGASFCT